jgi:hypothetical protein
MLFWNGNKKKHATCRELKRQSRELMLSFGKTNGAGSSVAILNLIDRQGLSHRLDTVEDWRVMEILRADVVGIKGISRLALAEAA